MKKILNSLFLGFCSLFIVSCGSENNEHAKTATKDTVVNQKENFAKAEIIDEVKNNLDNTQTYSLYLPGTYSTDKTYPVIYLFDPHGTGKLPVSLYKNLAEKYGYILVGSNSLKNGLEWQEAAIIFDKLYTDTKNRLAINSQRIYLAGFSGGARIANGITILNGNIAGVVCIGAVYPARNSETPRNNYTLLAIAGNEDMNYNELVKYDMIDLAGHNLKHALITYDGKHEWCPESVMNEAFLWLEFNEMRKNVSAKNDGLIKEYFTPLEEELKNLMESKNYMAAYKLTKKTINFYDGLTDLNNFYDAYKQLKTIKEIDLALQKEEQAMQDEDKLRASYAQYFQSKDYAWWQKEIISINTKSKSAKSKEEQQMYKRLSSYLSLICYSQTNGMLQQNNIPAAEYFDKLYLLVDPTNSEAHYFSALINARKNKKKETFDALNAAVKNGFNEKSRIEADSVFAKYSGSEEFKKVLEKL
jgi:hypothetical protein